MDTEKLSKKYRAELAENYDEERKRRPKWIEEEKVIDRILSNLTNGKKVIDVPVGTGRFAHLYKEYDLDVVGVDVSDDMLSIADLKARELDLEWSLSLGDIRQLPWPDRTFDVSICIRLFQWFSVSEIVSSLKELARVSNTVVFGAPTYMRLRDIYSVNDLKTYLLQWKLRFYKWRTSSDLQCHDSDAILSAIAAADLHLVDKFPIYSNRHEYAIYVTRARTQ